MAKSVLQALTLLGLSVAAHSYVISFNNPQQCGVVQIAWTKSSTSAAQLQFPLLLHILPFDSVAITQPIDGWNESMTVGSVMVNFDLRSGTEFLLAVTDQLGQGAGPVSDVKTASASSDTSCLSSTKDSPGHFEVFTTPDAAECPSITVNWDGTVQSSRPTILAFSPELLPVNMDPPLSDAPSDRTVTSNGIFTSMSQVVILFIDINLPGTTSQFLTVGGEDRGSCMSQATNTVATNEGTNTIGSPPPTYSAMAQSAGKVIGGVAAGVIAFGALTFIALVYRRKFLLRGPVLPEKPKAHSGTCLPAPETPESGILPEKVDSPVVAAPIQVTPNSGVFLSGSNPPSPIPPLPGWGETSGKASDKAQDLTNNISEDKLSQAVQVTFPKTPLTRRRSWVSRPLSVETERSDFGPWSVTDSSETGNLEPLARPDSPTLPETRLPSSVPSTPLTSRSRSQRSVKRSQYIKLDEPSAETQASSSGEVHNHRASLSSQKSRLIRISRGSRGKKGS